MSWTDDRVAKLAKLWADGLSASQIAAELGGVTRNAVIGKVHRLGLSGRVKPTTGNTAKPRRKPASRPGSTGGTGSGGGASQGGGYTNARASNRGGGGTVGNAALKMEMEMDAAPEMRMKAAEDVVVPMSRKITLLELTEETCKWPTGDPTRPGFSFCGHGSQEGKPYCEFHSKLAFQPPSERRRRR